MDNHCSKEAIGQDLRALKSAAKKNTAMTQPENAEDQFEVEILVQRVMYLLRMRLSNAL